LAAATQLGWIHAGWTAVTNLGTLMAVWAFARMGGSGTVTAISLLCAGQLIPGWLAAFSLARRLSWQGRVNAEAPLVWQLWHAGRKFAAPNLAGALLTAAAPAAVARFGGYAASAAFTVLQRLFGTAQQAHAMALAPLWPAWAEAMGHGENAWVRHSLRLALGFTAVVCVAVGIAAAALPGIIHLWLGAGASVPPAINAWLMAAWISAAMFGQTLSYFLLSVGRLERIALSIATAHALTFVGIGLLGYFIDGTGVVAALAAGAALGTLPLLIRECTATWRGLTQKHSTDSATAAIS
jgi:O-antigen/teichoic acid export membrane protein